MNHRENTFRAFVVETDGTLYIPSLGAVVHVENINEGLYDELLVKIYVFVDEATLWRKVKVQVV